MKRTDAYLWAFAIVVLTAVTWLPPTASKILLTLSSLALAAFLLVLARRGKR